MYKVECEVFSTTVACVLLIFAACVLLVFEGVTQA